MVILCLQYQNSISLDICILLVYWIRSGNTIADLLLMRNYFVVSANSVFHLDDHTHCTVSMTFNWCCFWCDKIRSKHTKCEMMWNVSWTIQWYYYIQILHHLYKPCIKDSSLYWIEITMTANNEKMECMKLKLPVKDSENIGKNIVIPRHMQMMQIQQRLWSTTGNFCNKRTFHVGCNSLCLKFIVKYLR